MIQISTNFAHHGPLDDFSASHIYPLHNKLIYLLSVYDAESISHGNYSVHPFHDEGWIIVGVAYFDATDKIIHIIDQAIKDPLWDDTSRTLSWSKAREGVDRTPTGYLRFSDNLEQFLGTVLTSKGAQQTVSGVIIDCYHTTRTPAISATPNVDVTSSKAQGSNFDVSHSTCYILPNDDRESLRVVAENTEVVNFPVSDITYKDIESFDGQYPETA